MFKFLSKKIFVRHSVSLMLLMTALMPSQSLAHDFEADGIFYNIIGAEAEVTFSVADDYISGYSEIVDIPETVSYEGVTYRVTRIGERAFKDSSGIQFLNIPGSVTEIARNALYDCNSLVEINVDPNNEYFSSVDGVLFNASKTSLIRVPAVLEEYYVPNTVEVIEERAFQYCASMKIINIPESVQSIGTLALDCLEYINVAQGNRFYSSDGGALFNVDKSVLIRVPRSYDSYSIPNTVAGIADFAFSSNNSLTMVEIPNSVLTIGRGAFASCGALTSVSIPNSVTTIGVGAFGYCFNLSSVDLPDTLEEIADSTFIYTSLASVDIPDTVKRIGVRAFQSDSRLLSVVIPKSVIQIGEDAFWANTHLAEVYVQASSPISLDHNPFETFCEGAVYYVPQGSLQTYSAADVWKNLNLHELPLPDIALNADRMLLVAGMTENLEVKVGELPVSTLKWSSSNADVAIVEKGVVKAVSPGNATITCTAEDKLGQIAQAICDVTVCKNKLTLEIEGCGKVLYKGAEMSSGVELSGDDLSFMVLPDDDYIIASVTIGDDDVTGRIRNHVIAVDGSYGHSILRIEFVPETETTLTVRAAETHSLTHIYQEGHRAKILIAADEGWELYSLAFNGEDVTSEVVGDAYTTPALTGDNNLDLVLRKSDITTGIDDIKRASRKVSFVSDGDTVTILNLDDKENITIYDATGVMLYQGDEHKVTLVSGKVYMLRTSQEVLKFAL